MPEIKEVKSTSKNGVSIISVELLETYFDLDPIWQRLRNKIAATQLPDGASRPSVNDEFGEVFPYVFALRGDGFEERELLDHGEDIRDALLEVVKCGQHASADKIGVTKAAKSCCFKLTRTTLPSKP